MATAPPRGGAPLERRLSSRSARVMHSLEALETRIRTTEDAVKAIDAQLALGFSSVVYARVKGELAQLVGGLDRLQAKDLDGIVTAELESGKTSARHYRKALHARVDALRSHASDLFDRVTRDLEQSSRTTGNISGGAAAKETPEESRRAADASSPEKTAPHLRAAAATPGSVAAAQTRRRLAEVDAARVRRDREEAENEAALREQRHADEMLRRRQRARRHRSQPPAYVGDAPAYPYHPYAYFAPPGGAPAPRRARQYYQYDDDDDDRFVYGGERGRDPRYPHGGGMPHPFFF